MYTKTYLEQMILASSSEVLVYEWKSFEDDLLFYKKNSEETKGLQWY